MSKSSKPSRAAPAWIVVLGALFVSSVGDAQSVRNQLTPDDIGGVMVTVYAPTDNPNIDDGTRTLLLNRMSSALSTGGLAGVGVITPFVLYPRVAVVDNVVVSGGLEERTQTKVELAFVLKHIDSRSVIHQWSGTLIGVGASASLAIRNAVSGLSSSDPRLATFARDARERIVDYYNQNCSAIRAQARTVARTGALEEAYAQLLAVPTDASACSRAATADADRLARGAETAQCERQLREARAEMAAGRLGGAADRAAAVPTGTPCAARADVLLTEIDGRAKAREDRTTSLQIESIKKSRTTGASVIDVVRGGRARVAAFFNRSESRTLRLDLIR
jgi:hypothetical protein